MVGSSVNYLTLGKSLLSLRNMFYSKKSGDKFGKTDRLRSDQVTMFR